MNRLTPAARAADLNCLIEGCSIRSTVRMTGVSKKAVSRLLVEAGAVSAEYQDRVMRNLTCRRIQVDELWTFCYVKDKNLTPEIAAKVPVAGSVWLWVAMDADTKLVPCVTIGDRNSATAEAFISDLASRLRHRVQMTTDGHRPYLEAVESAFGAQVDTRSWSTLRQRRRPPKSPERRYGPGRCIGTVPTVISGGPDPAHISTSFVERQNCTVRRTMRRYTRLSNGFSRKIENHMAAAAINYFAYNFIKIHRSLRVTPAMAAGVADRLFDVSDLLNLLIEAESKKAA